MVDTTKLGWSGGTTQSVRGLVDNCEHDECQKEDKENQNPDLPRGHNIPQQKSLDVLAIATVFQITALRAPPNN